MRSRQDLGRSKQVLLLFLIVATSLTSACSKKPDRNTDENIQQIVDQTNQENKKEVDRIKAEFEEIEKKTSQIINEADEALAAIQKTNLNYVNKMVRVDVLNDKDQVQKSYLDFFEIDSASGSYKSKFESLFLMDGAGICINLSSLDCEATFNIKTLTQKMGTVSAGRYKMTEAFTAQLSNIPEMTYSSKSKVIALERDHMIVELKTNPIYMGQVVASSTSAKKIKISTLGKLSQEKHGFFSLTEDKSDRKDVTAVDDNLKRLAISTVQVLIDSEGGSILNGAGNGHGTGFFISDDGLMLTNNHVANGLADCINFHKCKVRLRQIDKDNKASTFTVDAKLLVTDAEMDFALLKISLTKEMKIEKLEIEDQEVQSDLMSLGYPGDRGDSRESTPLSYSFGKLVGAFDLGYTTSVYISGGASGSALLNFGNKKVVAIVSNGNNPVPGEDGAPGVARPIQLINAKFGVDDYLDGSKETRVTKILQMLKVSSTPSESSKALKAFDNERTFLGLGVMKSIMLSHQDINIRKLIMQYLQERKVVLGPDEM